MKHAELFLSSEDQHHDAVERESNDKDPESATTGGF